MKVEITVMLPSGLTRSFVGTRPHWKTTEDAWAEFRKIFAHSIKTEKWEEKCLRRFIYAK